MRKITMDMELRFIDHVSNEANSASKTVDKIEKKAKQASDSLDKLGKKKSKPTIDADSSRIDKKLSKLDSVLKKFGSRKTKTTIDVNDKASAKLSRVLNKAKSWAGKKYSAFIEAKDNAMAKLSKLMSRGKAWAGKKFEAFLGLKDSKALNTLNNMSNKLRSFTGKTWSTAIKIKDTFTKPLAALKNSLFSIQTLIAGIASAWAAIKFVKEPIALADAYSSAQIGFSTLLGESQGQQMMNDLDAFAKATPFKSSEVISQTQRMIAMGWDAESIIEDMTTIGDAAAATGKGEQGLQQIVTALAQIKTKGKLSTEELNQLAEAGVSAKKYIAEGLGYGSGDEGIAKMTADLEDGAISSGKALEALLSGMQEYQGMMDKTANETVSGLWSQIEDTFEINIARRWGQGLQDGAKKSFGSIVDLIETADGALTEFGDTVYEVGKKISHWVADKLENAVERVTEITGSFEFKEAGLAKKISMLWNGVVVDPLKEWWEGGGQQKSAETAGEIGEWMGKAITDGLLALFGVTDILDDETASKLGESGGMSIAQSFAKGFKENFDGSAITEALVDAISDVWGALPWWAKILIGGYGIGKAAGGLASFAGGIASFAGGVKNVAGGFSVGLSSAPILTSSGSGLAGLLGKTGVRLGASTAGSAILMGGAGIAGGLAAGASVIKGGADLYGSYKAYKAGDETEGKAKMRSGTATLTAAGTGALIGSLFGPVGTLVGAGIGGLVGMWSGNRQADKIREEAAALKFESEAAAEAYANAEDEQEKALIKQEAIYESMKNHMGDIKLSAAEIERLANQVVWGEDLAKFDKFTSAVRSAEASMQSLNSAGEQTDRWMWKAGLGVKFNDDEIESIKASFDDYISSAKSYVEDKHYEFTAAVSLLMDVESAEGKNILDSGNAFYAGLKDQLDDLGGKLSKSVDIALEDGVISLNEEKEIINLQQQIASITEKIANAEQKAELELINLKFGSGNLSLDSYDAFMAQMQTTLDQAMAGYDEAFTASVTNLNLQLEEGAITQEEYDKQLQDLVDGYDTKIDNLKAQIENVELEIIGDAFANELGSDAASKLQTALDEALKTGIDPIEWTDEELCNLLGVDSLKEDTAGAIKTMLSGVAEQVGVVNIEIDLDPKINMLEPNPEDLETVFSVDANVNTNWTYDEFDKEWISPDGNYSFSTKALVEAGWTYNEFEDKWISPDSKYSFSTEADIKVDYKVNKFNGFRSDFGISSSYAFKQQVVIDQVPKARGGIVGGSSNLEAFATGGIADGTDGGMVRGGAQIIKVAEEGSPEMIIPLSSQRRDRGLKLWEKAGHMLGVPGFSRGGRTDGSRDEGFRFHEYSGGNTEGGRAVEVNVNGVQVELHIHTDGGGNIADAVVKAIKEQAGEISDALAGVIADALVPIFENTPARGGA